MRVLISDDDPVSLRMLQALLTKWGYDVVSTTNGTEALAAMQQPDAPSLGIFDWQMPGMNGVDLCKQVRSREESRHAYLLLLTSKNSKEDIVTGLEAGADDYLAKPFDRDELRARLHVGVRILQLQSELAERVRQLESALANVKLLHGLLPICCYCKKVRNDSNYWQQVETYIMEHSAAQFSHGICPDCYESVVKPELEALKRKPQAVCCGHD